MSPIRAVLIALLWSLHFMTFAQATKKLMDQGDKFYAKQDFIKARTAFQAAEKIDPNDAKIQLKIGLTYLSSSPKFQSLNHLERAYKLDQAVDPDIHYYLGVSNQLNFHFKKAQKHFELYKERNKRMAPICDHKIEECKRADSLMNTAVSAIVKVMDWPVNSPYDDYGPLLNATEDKLIFTSARDSSFFDRRTKTLFEEIFISELKDGVWSVPQKISNNINNQFHDAAASLTRDGNTLIVYYGEGNGDLYRSDFNGSSWSKPVTMGPQINGAGSNETSGCFTPDGNRFYFASDRPEGYGGLDIYYVEKDKFGDWSNPVNLGPDINTPGNEDAPFLHTDSIMYFGSDTHPGLGSYDIFKAVSVNGKWKKPENLGYPVNTAEYENFFHLSEDKKRGYYASVRQEGSGRTDLCMVTFLEPEVTVVEVDREEAETAPQPASDEFVDPLISLQKDLGIATALKGTVIDAQSSLPLRAQIVLINNETNTIVSRVYSNPANGQFTIDIPHGGNYGINTSVDGYLFNSMNFEVPTFSEYVEIDTHILMAKAETGSKVVLKNVFFDSGKADLKKESIAEMDRILNLLNKNPNLRLQVNGHTDSEGDDNFNKQLSLKRAQSVVNYLINNGVDKDRLVAVGFGEERPLVSNDDEMEGREINRRTELEIISNINP